MELLSWWNLIFLIPLAVGILFAIGSSFGIGGEGDHDIDHDLDMGHDIDMDHDLGVDHDVCVDHDVDHDIDGDMDHDHHGGQGVLDMTGKKVPRHVPFGFRVLGLIGVGKAPMSIVLMCLNLIWGGTGMIMNLVFGPLFLLVTIPVAAGSTIFLTGAFAALVGKLVPKMESYNVVATDLVGRFGEITLRTRTDFGRAMVVDQYGGRKWINCRSKEGELAPRSKIVVASYDSGSNTYLVIPDKLRNLDE